MDELHLENARLRAALRPFAAKVAMFDQFKGLREDIKAYCLTYADFKRAKQALTPYAKEERR